MKFTINLKDALLYVGTFVLLLVVAFCLHIASQDAVAPKPPVTPAPLSPDCKCEPIPCPPPIQIPCPPAKQFQVMCPFCRNIMTVLPPPVGSIGSAIGDNRTKPVLGVKPAAQSPRIQ